MRIKQLLSILFICLYTATHCGCAQLLALPIFIIMLPFQILQIVIGLLPTVIKYAPLALLFVKNDSPENDELLKAVVSDIKNHKAGEIMQVCSLVNGVTCYKIRINNDCQQTGALALNLQKLLSHDENVRLLFTDDDVAEYDATKSLEIWQYMEHNQIQIGRDSRLSIAKDSTCTDRSVVSGV
jgi:hypothetical protein